MKNFLLDLRDNTVLAFAWLVFTWMIFYSLNAISDISIFVLWQLLVLSLTGSMLFHLIFATIVFKKTSFSWRLTYFIVSCTFIESILIYYFQLFGITTLAGWGLFLMIVIALYIASIGIFHIYKIKSSKHYTKLLKQYQQKGVDKNVT